MTLARAVLLSLLLSHAAPASATKIFKCKNEKGEIYYAQAYDPERCTGGGAQLNAQGLTVRTIERRRTPEEIAADEARAAAEAEAQRKIEAERKADQVLLLSYANVEDLERAQQQQLEVIDEAIRSAQLQAERQQKALVDLLATAAEAERAGKPVPQAVTDNIAAVRGMIEQQNTIATRKQAERMAALIEFSNRVERYNELKARSARPR